METATLYAAAHAVIVGVQTVAALRLAEIDEVAYREAQSHMCATDTERVMVVTPNLFECLGHWVTLYARGPPITPVREPKFSKDLPEVL